MITHGIPPAGVKLPNGQDGLTLIEVVIALAISSLLVLMATTALSAASGYLHRQEVRGSAKDGREGTFQLLRHDLSFARKLLVANPRKLEFGTALHHQAEGAQVPGRVSFECVKRADGLVDLARTSYPVVEFNVAQKAFVPKAVDANWVSMHTEVVAIGLSACSFEYGLMDRAGSAPGTRAAEWISDWGSQPGMPTLVRVQMNLYQNDWPRAVFALSGHAS